MFLPPRSFAVDGDFISASDGRRTVAERQMSWWAAVVISVVRYGPNRCQGDFLRPCVAPRRSAVALLPHRQAVLVPHFQRRFLGGNFYSARLLTRNFYNSKFISSRLAVEGFWFRSSVAEIQCREINYSEDLPLCVWILKVLSLFRLCVKSS